MQRPGEAGSAHVLGHQRRGHFLPFTWLSSSAKVGRAVLSKTLRPNSMAMFLSSASGRTCRADPGDWHEGHQAPVTQKDCDDGDPQSPGGGQFRQQSRNPALIALGVAGRVHPGGAAKGVDAES